MAPITRCADREEAVAAPTDFLAKRPVHDVGAAPSSDWTRQSQRGTGETTGSVAVGASRRSRGPGGFSSRPSPHSPHCAAYATAARPFTPGGLWNAAAARDAQNASTAAWKPHRTRFPTSVHSPFSFSFRRTRRTQTRIGTSTLVQIDAFQVSADKRRARRAANRLPDAAKEAVST